MNRSEVLQVVAVLSGAFPNVVQRMSAQQGKAWAEVYATGLIDLDFESCKSAVERLIKSSQWLSVAAIREAVVTHEQGQQRSGAEAWGDVMRAVSGCGRYREPRFTDPIVGHIVRSLGWVEICDSENTVSDRARFVEAYNTMAAQGRVQAVVSEGARAPALPSRSALALVEGVAKKLGGGE